MTLKVAITQPFFFPYAGYYRLFAAADLFVVLDCVQFPRRGWVHRNRLADSQGQPQWLTLPLVKGPRDTTRICDLRFAHDVHDRLPDQLKNFPAIAQALIRFPALESLLRATNTSVTNYLFDTLKWTTQLLQLDTPMVLSSSLANPPELKNQDRLIAICKQVGATHYINAPSGRELYSPAPFHQADISLQFLPRHEGSFQCMLERLATEPLETLRAEILGNTSLEGCKEPEMVQLEEGSVMQ